MNALLRFTIENFRSFSERKSLVLINKLESATESSKITYNKVCALYGANSSGKSNLIDGFSQMLYIIINSVKVNDDDELAFDPFLLNDRKNSPTSYEIEFILDDIQYRYGFSNTSEKIISEWLFIIEENEKETPLFIRNEDGIGVNEKAFQEGIDMEERTNDNRLFLSLVAQLGGNLSKSVITYISKSLNTISGLDTEGYQMFSKKMLREDSDVAKSMKEFFISTKLGFSDVTTQILDFDVNAIPSDVPEELKKRLITELKGKTFKTLDESLQNKITDYSIRTITFTADSDPDLQYEIFSRLNTGSVALNSQELRNCIYRGEFNEFIKDLASDSEYLALLGLKSPHKRMTDVELVLRFVSFYKNTYINYKSPIKMFLNETMRTNKNIDEIEKKKIKEAFKRAVTNLTSLLGENSFRRFKIIDKEGVWEKNRLNVALFDILMDSMARLDTTVLMRHLDAIKEAYIDLMVSNQEFIDSIMINTSDTPVVSKRFKIWNSVLDSIIGDDKVETRCFTKAFKQKLFDADPTCAICNQNINSIDDAAVDHVEQYWMGGKTIPENARLTHRYCNWSRSRKDKTE